ncbi:RNA polymerase III subunit [Perkinsela sp. CCAP 1560/4]|nr:RNA polymerase III subunit [Perkinsela sp. CCAP 1560/4]|eukprot:KNH01789.1 RNA polymerase III subunit [Perkinsela sp. CCAP 1560/4]
MKEFDIFLNSNPPGSLHSIHCPLGDKKSPIRFDKINQCKISQTNKLLTFVVDCSHAVQSGSYQHTLHEFREQTESGVTSFVAVCRNNEIHLSEITQNHQLYPTIGAVSTGKSETPQSSSEQAEDASKILVPRALSYKQDTSWKQIHFLTGSADHAAIAKLFFASAAQQRRDPRVPDLWKSVLPLMHWTKLSLQEAITSQPVNHQIYRIMHNIQVLSLRELASLLNFDSCQTQRSASGVDSQQLEELVLSALRECSVYIDGVWVCKSPYPAISIQLQYVREYILLRFFRARQDGLSRVALAEELPAITHAEILRILEMVSSLDNETKRWRLKDLSLGQQPAVGAPITVPEYIVYDEKAAWTKREPQIIRNAKVTCKDDSSLTMPWRFSTTESIENESASATAGTRDRERALTSVQRDEVKSYVRDLYGIHGVIHGSRIMPLIRDEKQKPTSRLRSLTEAQIFEALKPLLIMLNRDKATAIRSWDFPELDVYRNVIIEILQRGNASREMIFREIKDRAAIPISEQTFRSIINELARFNVNEGMWSFKSGLDM